MVPPSLPLLLLLLPPPQAAMPNAATAAVNPTTATFRSFLTLFPPVSFAAPVGIVPAPTGSDISALKPSQAAQQGRNTGISPTLYAAGPARRTTSFWCAELASALSAAPSCSSRSGTGGGSRRRRDPIALRSVSGPAGSRTRRDRPSSRRTHRGRSTGPQPCPDPASRPG